MGAEILDPSSRVAAMDGGGDVYDFTQGSSKSVSLYSNSQRLYFSCNLSVLLGGFPLSNTVPEVTQLPAGGRTEKAIGKLARFSC